MSAPLRKRRYLQVLPGLSGVEAAEWDALLQPGDRPLLSWAYLQGLEQTGCVGEDSGWRPAHILLYRDPGDLIAAAPAYLKSHSDGEWVYDLDWAAFARQHGMDYYPKLVLAVPFNPVGGRRLLVRPDLPEAERRELEVALLQGARALCQHAELSSVHLHFPPPAQRAAAQAAGFAWREQEQYHFLNEGYRSFDDFLGRLRAHRRHSIRRERRALVEAGVTVRTHAGLRGPARPDGFAVEELDAVFDMYVGTSQRYTGERPFLNRAFFHLCAQRLGERLELVLARARDGRLLGGAWNLRGERRIYGRYWGRSRGEAEAEPVPFLHFEVCFYHSIERCIALGLEAFEPGHGGEQKLLRGFWPVLTYSAHYLREPRLRRPIETFLDLEAPCVVQGLAASRSRSPLKKDIF